VSGKRRVTIIRWNKASKNKRKKKIVKAEEDAVKEKEKRERGGKRNKLSKKV